MKIDTESCDPAGVAAAHSAQMYRYLQALSRGYNYKIGISSPNRIDQKLKKHAKQLKTSSIQPTTGGLKNLGPPLSASKTKAQNGHVTSETCPKQCPNRSPKPPDVNRSKALLGYSSFWKNILFTPPPGGGIK